MGARVMLGKSPISPQGKITIDKAILKKLGVKPGMIAYQRIIDGHLEIDFLPDVRPDSLAGIFHQEGSPPWPKTSEELEVEMQEAMAEKWERLGYNF